MSYNKQQFAAYIDTAGKITIFTAFLGVVVFSIIFLLNIGAKEFKEATAQGVATTSVTVLNTPPQFTAGPYELIPSSTSTPTNSGDQVTWAGTAVDSNGEDWFLLVCNGNATPTAASSSAPSCGGSDLLWAVSATTSSGAQATAATTTTESFPPYAESNDWYAWACDAVQDARCTSVASQGTTSTSTPYQSPFNVNRRPLFTGYWNTSPADPGTTVVFYATSTDNDVDPTQDTVSLYICSTNSFNSTSSLGCNGSTLAQTTFAVHPNATATYALPAIIQDDDYNAYPFIVDEHGHEAIGSYQGTNTPPLTVNNVAPTISSSTITLNGGVDMSLVEGVENTGFTLSFVVTDANSCDAVGGGNNDEFSTTTISVFRSGVGTSSCDGLTIGQYDPNDCYPSILPSETWDLQCTASSGSCTAGGGDSTMTVDCTFPLWFVADPTEGSSIADTFYFAEHWTAGISATDDDGATSTFERGQATTTEVLAVTALNLLSPTIAYGGIEPGDDTGTLSASTTVESTGNTGLDQGLTGEAMCGTYTTGSPCPTSPTQTIPESEQEFATSSLSYGSGTSLSSSTQYDLLLQVDKTTATDSPNTGVTWWGIAVPATITLAGSYTGENTFVAVKSDPATWY